jgi:hypothetical protein
MSPTSHVGPITHTDRTIGVIQPRLLSRAYDGLMSIVDVGETLSLMVVLLCRYYITRAFFLSLHMRYNI